MPLRGVRRPWLRRDESGILIILFAVLIIGLLGMVAIVIDLSQLRNVRRTAQSISDFASLAAAAELADITGSNPVQACINAFEYVRKNTPDFPVAATMPCDALVTSSPSRVPCSEAAPVTPPLEMQAVGDAPYDVRIVYPVPDPMIDDPRRGGSGTNDGSLCERLRVSLDKAGGSLFAKVFGVHSLNQGASSTARGFVRSEGENTPALLILESQSCGALQASGQGGVLAKGSGVKPGIIAVNSAGSVTPGGCSDASNAGGKVVYGTALPPAHPHRPGLPSIEALPADTPDSSGVMQPALLQVFAMDTPNSARAAYITPSGVKPNPQGGPRFSRNPVDTRYGAGIASLRATSAAPPEAYTNLSSLLPGCKADAATKRITATNVRIDCDVSYQGGPSGSDEIIFTGSHFVTTRNIEVPSGRKWTFSNPIRIVVNRNDTNKPGVVVRGTLWVNTGTGLTDPTPAALAENFCTTDRNGPGFGSTRFVVRDGGFSVEGSSLSVKLCQTTLYMGHGAASPRPENEDNFDKGTVNVGGGTTDWTAPDQTELRRCDPPLVTLSCYDSSLPQFELEDLALWTESAPLSNIGGAGNVFLTGVFFLPNATFRFTGQAEQNIDRNAQFVSRKLDMAGRGTLILKPNPNESVTFRKGVSLLIR